MDVTQVRTLHRDFQPEAAEECGREAARREAEAEQAMQEQEIVEAEQRLSDARLQLAASGP